MGGFLMNNPFFKMRSGNRNDLLKIPQRDSRTLYICKDGGIYLGNDLVADVNAYLPIVTYRAVRLSGSDKLIVAQLKAQGSFYLTDIDDGAMIVVINPDSVYASPGVTRIEDESNLDSISFPEGVSVYMDGKATGFTAVAYNGVLYPLPSN